MPEFLDWRQTADTRSLVCRAAQALAEGGVVAFPTDTVYTLAASALVPEAVERLHAVSGERPLTVAVRGALEALDWVPQLSPLGRRLARRCWPGPLTLVCGEGIEQGLVSGLAESVRRQVCPAGTLNLRAPAHRAILQVMRLLPGALLLSGDPGSATTAQALVDATGDTVTVVIDDGPSFYGRPATVVQVSGNSWHVLHEGAMPVAEIEQQSTCLILFVCTGNTCRSPLAEVLCKKKLAERLGCAVEDLPQRGFLVISAGLAAMMGGGAAPEAIEVARAYGADLSKHVSRPLTADLAVQADHLVAMTRGHVLALLEGCPGLEAMPRLLSPEGGDIADPIGCDQEVYRQCAEQIWNHLDRLVADIIQ
jgi:protein-tyrosine phosphatase